MPRGAPPAPGAAGAPPPPPPPAATAGTAALDAVHLGGREAQARADLVGDDLDDAALLALLGLPAALLEPAGDDDAGALLQRRADVVGELTPARRR